MLLFPWVFFLQYIGDQRRIGAGGGNGRGGREEVVIYYLIDGVKVLMCRLLKFFQFSCLCGCCPLAGFLKEYVSFPSAVSSWQNPSSMQKIPSDSTSVKPLPPLPHFKALKAQLQAYHQNVLLNENPTSSLWSLQGVLLELRGRWKFGESYGSFSLNQSWPFLPFSFCLKG